MVRACPRRAARSGRQRGLIGGAVQALLSGGAEIRPAAATGGNGCGPCPESHRHEHEYIEAKAPAGAVLHLSMTTQSDGFLWATPVRRSNPTVPLAFVRAVGL